MSIIRKQPPGWGSSALRPTASAETSALLRANPSPALRLILAPKRDGKPMAAPMAAADRRAPVERPSEGGTPRLASRSASKQGPARQHKER